MGRINWWMVAALTLGVVVVFLVGASLLPGWWGYAWETGREMRPWSERWAAWGWWPWGPFFGCLMPLLWLGCIILGIVWMVRMIGAPSSSWESWCMGRPRPRPTCPGCSRPVEADWQLCPYCGHKLK